MKIIYKIILLLLVCFSSYSMQAQPGRGIKQPPKINNVLNATNKAIVKAKVHANSNSVYRAKNQTPKDKPKKGELKKEEELEKTSGKKRKK